MYHTITRVVQPPSRSRKNGTEGTEGTGEKRYQICNYFEKFDASYWQVQSCS